MPKDPYEQVEINKVRVSTRPTVKMDPSEIIAAENALLNTLLTSLANMGADDVYAYKLGQLALLQECVRQMALPDAHADLVTRARAIVERLARLPWEPR